MSNSTHLVLGIESAIAGGSLSLLRTGVEIANWIGTADVLRAENLLANIDQMLTANEIDKHDLDLIAASAGPGSFTGIRIGIATAIGLKTGLEIELASRSALYAMAFVQPLEGQFITAIPMGRSAICVQSIEKHGSEVLELDEPHTIPEADLFESVRTSSDRFILHEALFAKIDASPNIVNCGANIAQAIARICAERPAVTEPLFVSKSF
jgi:tRNA threonylcarbamoyl adenosine modification protein YeaZ